MEHSYDSFALVFQISVRRKALHSFGLREDELLPDLHVTRDSWSRRRITTGEVQSWGPINWAAFLTSKRVQPTPPQCRPGLLVLEPLWVWPLLSLQVPFYPYRTCFTIQTYQGLVQLRMTTIRPRKQLD